MKRLELLLLIIRIPLDILMLLMAGVAAYLARHSEAITVLRPVVFSLSKEEYLTRLFPVILVTVLLFATLGLYRPRPSRLMADIGHIVAGLSMSLSGVALVLLFTQSVFDSRFLVAATFGFALITVSFGRLVLHIVRLFLYRNGYGVRRVILVGEGTRADALSKLLTERSSLGYRIVAHIPFWVQQEFSHPSPFDQILFVEGTVAREGALQAMEYAAKHHVIFSYVADIFDTFNLNMSIHPIGGLPVVELRSTPLEGWGRVVKRIIDIAVSVFFLIIFSPFFLLFSALVFFETGRPVIYKNERIGLRAKHFFILKFRSMYQKDSTGPQFGAAGEAALLREADLIQKKNTKTGPIYKIGDDPRVTPIGRFLRRFSFDELPQFFNVLKGEMSLVGPRPHQPREVAQYGDSYPHIFAIKPGITGLAQISGRSDLSFEEEMRLDTYYVERWSIWLDFLVMLKTPFVILRRRRAL